MIIELRRNSIVVKREAGDRRFYKDDSRLLHHVKLVLRRMGFDCIKKLAWKDGHLVDDHLHYIRERGGAWCMWDTQSAIRSLAAEFDTAGEVVLAVQGSMTQ